MGKNNLINLLDLKKITDIVVDSRQVKRGSLFFALNGTKHNGRDFVPNAIKLGAAAIVVEGESFKTSVINDVNVIETETARELLSLVAAKFYRSPLEDSVNIAVTGTNGKTTISWLICQVLRRLRLSAAQIGTLGFRLNNEADFRESSTTTPDALDVHKYLASVLSPEFVVVEMSSHALSQKRLTSVDWDVGIFSNLTRDHLDYHKTLEAYAEAKALLFEKELARSAKKNKFAIINLDDDFGLELEKRLRGKIETRVFSYSSKSERADVFSVTKSFSSSGIESTLKIFGEEFEFRSLLIGEHNLSNLLAVITSLMALGFRVADVLSALDSVKAPPGRLELVSAKGIQMFVDYAHTPDALLSVLSVLKPLSKGNLIVVFGCGGDRDVGKRPLMGAAASRYADRLIVTSDNPRSEDPDRILKDIALGIDRKDNVSFVPDRRQAIIQAVQLASAGDIVLVAGKGHEDYQEVSGKKSYFSDVKECEEALTNK